MVYLAAATVLVGLLGLLNFFLLLAVIRKLRRMSQEGLSHRPGVRVPGLLAVGSRAPEFAATATSGRHCDLAGLSGRGALIGFFSGTCDPCRDHMPGFVRLAGQLPDGADQAIAVVRGPDATAAELLGMLGDSATVIREAENGPVGTAFSVRTYPTAYFIDGTGVIASAAHLAEHLSVPILR